MEEEIKQLKSVLRSLVVSSPSQVDLRSLCRDYRNMVGKQIPNLKYGYPDMATFLREKFSDCFIFKGPPANPVLTLIVPDSLKHIDKFVQKQKTSTSAKFRGKRTSVPESVAKPVETDLIVKSFKSKSMQKNEQKKEQERPPCIDIVSENSTSLKPDKTSPQFEKSENETSVGNGNCSKSALQNFLKRRTALYQSQVSMKSLSISEESSSGKDLNNRDDYSERQTSSSLSSGQRSQLEQLKQELTDIVLSHPDGVWCGDLLRIYRERYGRELVFPRFGYSSVLGVAFTLPGVGVSRQAVGDWLLYDASALQAPPTLPPQTTFPPPPSSPRVPATDDEDALPGIDYDPDVFPPDCMHFTDSIPGPSLEDVAPGSMLEVAVAEVYSPSHFWLLRLGERHNIAMEDMMDDMNRYYERGEGRERALAPAAVRVGHYCASCYEGDWHRSLIVKIVDADTVKVRHVDYGTVEAVRARALRPLRRAWAALAAQAVRARLAAARPPAAGRRWPRAAALAFLRLVQQRRLVANVVAVDARDAALEVLLIDTSGPVDRCLGDELVRAGHADPRPDSALATSECYLYPRFEALETGDTPNFAEIHAYLRDGIALECVEDYRRHVPPILPASPSPPPTPPRSPTPPASPATPSLSTEPVFSPPVSPSPPTDPAPSLVPPQPEPAPSLGAAWAGPAPVPLGAWGARVAMLTAQECETYAVLSVVRPAAAHRFMLAALSRALAPYPAPSPLNPLAASQVLNPLATYPNSFSPIPSLNPSAPHLAPNSLGSCLALNPMAQEFKMTPRGGSDVRPPPGFDFGRQFR